MIGLKSITSYTHDDFKVQLRFSNNSGAELTLDYMDSVKQIVEKLHNFAETLQNSPHHKEKENEVGED